MECSTPDFYRLLGLESRQHDPDLPSHEVKKAYKRALLRFHPDKKKPPSASASAAASVTVDDVALAYKTLSEPLLRAAYDRQLHATCSHASAPSGAAAGARPYHTGLETVDLDDLIPDEAAATWSRACRCGGGFVVTEAALEANVEDGEVIVGCRGCSLWLRVLFGLESET